jgi:hypothetical protein
MNPNSKVRFTEDNEANEGATGTGFCAGPFLQPSYPGRSPSSFGSFVAFGESVVGFRVEWRAERTPGPFGRTGRPTVERTRQPRKDVGLPGARLGGKLSSRTAKSAVSKNLLQRSG